MGPNGEDDATRGQKKREAITETIQKRLLEKRTRESGPKGGKAATELETRMMKSKPRLREYCLDGVDLLGILAFTFSLNKL